MSASVESQPSAEVTLTKRGYRKRKLVNITSGQDDASSHGSKNDSEVAKQAQNPRKKQKRVTSGLESRNMSSLPVDFLGHIFEFTDPKTLGRLMRVCKSFNAVLMEHSMVSLS